MYIGTQERLLRLETFLVIILEVRLESCVGSTVMFDEQMLDNFYHNNFMCIII